MPLSSVRPFSALLVTVCGAGGPSSMSRRAGAGVRRHYVPGETPSPQREHLRHQLGGHPSRSPRWPTAPRAMTPFLDLLHRDPKRVGPSPVIEAGEDRPKRFPRAPPSQLP